MTGKPLLPPSYLLMAILLMVVAFFLFPGMGLIALPWNMIGLLPLGFGVWINLAADASFQRAKTTVKPFEKPSVLVTDGVFKISRNPMYLGFLAILLGVGLLLGVFTPFLAVIVFPVLMEWKFIRVEEQHLEEEFGQAWLEYKQKVRRWI